MVVDALLEADAALGITEKIWDPKEFVLLDDTILDVCHGRDDCRNFLTL